MLNLFPILLCGPLLNIVNKSVKNDKKKSILYDYKKHIYHWKYVGKFLNVIKAKNIMKSMSES